MGGVFHLLTAKHVVAEFRDGKFTGRLKDDSLVAYFNRTDGTIGRRLITQLKKTFHVDWIFHKRLEVDLAVLPFGIETNGDDVLAIPDSLFLDSNSLSELTDVFFVSYQPGIISKDRIRPIYRVGTVSLLLPDKTFYVDGPIFPGNSGSPVFVRPQPTGFSESGPPVFPAPNSGKFIGIVGEYLAYQEYAISQKTQKPRVLFEENTGLSKVWSIDLIQEIISSAPFQEQLMRIKNATTGNNAP